MSNRTIEETLNLSYTIEVIKDSTDGYTAYVARVVELPGCLTQADTYSEVGEMVEEAMHLWIQTALEDGQSIPQPRPLETYSGKFVVRLPKSLHRELVDAATREGVSLNTLVNTALSHFIGRLAQPSSGDEFNPQPAPHRRHPLEEVP